MSTKIDIKNNERLSDYVNGEIVLRRRENLQYHEIGNKCYIYGYRPSTDSIADKAEPLTQYQWTICETQTEAKYRFQSTDEGNLHKEADVLLIEAKLAEGTDGMNNTVVMENVNIINRSKPELD
jgi:hypothetical protein